MVHFEQDDKQIQSVVPFSGLFAKKEFCHFWMPFFLNAFTPMKDSSPKSPIASVKQAKVSLANFSPNKCVREN